MTMTLMTAGLVQRSSIAGQLMQRRTLMEMQMQRELGLDSTGPDVKKRAIESDVP